MTEGNCRKCLRLGVIFIGLFWVLCSAEIAAADINDQVAQLDFDTADLNDVITIFGQPIRYHWDGRTYTRDNLPGVYIAQYPNEFGVVMASGRVDELRFESPRAGYVFRDRIRVGSPIAEVLSVVGQPTETIFGASPSGPFKDGVLYKDINGTAGYCYYFRSDQEVRFFFRAYRVIALYLTGNPSAPLDPISEFDDVRSKNLSMHDLSDRPGLIRTLTFNLETIWPEPAKMPPGYDPNEILTKAINPGLGVRQLHQQGFTGAGVSVAIIDQPLYQDHPEYVGKIAAYYDTGCDGAESSMHGPAVASLLVGSNCGTAPGARVYYAAAPSWKKDAAYYARALDWIISQNELLPPSEKIRVVSVSAAPSGPGSPFERNQVQWDEACTRAKAAGILVLDCTTHRGLIGRCWYDPNDPENADKCTPGTPGQSPWFDPNDILAPASIRTTAQHYDYQGRNSYIYWGRGGLSWSIPYCAGVLALGWEIRPGLTADQMVEMLLQSAYVTVDGAKIINPQEFIRGLTDASSLEATIRDIQKVIAEKREALERLNALLEEEQAAYYALEELLDSGDYRGLKKGHMVKAKQKIHSSIQHLRQSASALEKSIKRLEDALNALSFEFHPKP